MMDRRSRPGRAWDAVIKIGGSLSRAGRLRPLIATLERLARRHRLLIVPGGGAFADLVRQERRRLRLPEVAAHRMALRGMDQYGLMLAALGCATGAIEDDEAAWRLAVRGRLPVLIASSLIEREPRLEKSFHLTSDSIAAYIAGRIGAARLVLLKSTDRGSGRIRNRREAGQIARLGVVDPLFPKMMPNGVETWIANGRHAGTIERLLRDQPPAVDRPARVVRAGRAARAGEPRRARRKAATRSERRTP